MGSELIFYGFSGLALCAAMLTVTRVNPIASAVHLVVTLFLMAGLYANLGADFVAAIQILVYAGAIMVLFLFVIMLLNLDPHQYQGAGIGIGEITMACVAVLAMALMGRMVMTQPSSVFQGAADQEFIARVGGSTKATGLLLFQNYVWPFELASMLILVAIVASIVIARKLKPGEEKR